jgi:hypothetical protein
MINNQTKCTLHYARKNNEEIEELVFNEFVSMFNWICDKIPKNIFDDDFQSDTVYLFTFEHSKLGPDTRINHIFVTEHLSFICDIINCLKTSLVKLDVFFLQEYDSYEDAYKVSLDMQEVSPLCYNN